MSAQAELDAGLAEATEIPVLDIGAYLDGDANELEKLVAVLRDPRGSTERMYFPVTEALLLTGLRWGEGAAWIWPHISLPERRIHISHALPKSRTVDVASLVATKTAAVWSIRIGRPLEELLFRQRQRSYVGREGSWVFPKAILGLPWAY